MINWLKNATVYQIYPSSFYDSNNDGIGDLKGITLKVDYVKKLGMTAIWLNPFYTSMFMDGGYDVVDFKNVDKRFGNLEDFKELLEVYHNNGIKVIIDMVLGHTSDKNPWFLESTKVERNQYSDYYIWTDSIFKTYKNKTILGLYPRNGGYYANYYACQPALNYGFNKVEDPEWQMKYDDPRLEPLRNEIISIMKYWLSLGVDGFRVDMANSLVKDPHFDSLDPEDNEGNIWLWDKLINGVRKDYPECGFIAEWVNPSISIPYCNFDVDFYTHDVPGFNTLVRNEPKTNLLDFFERGTNYFNDPSKQSFDEFLQRYQLDLTNIKDKGAVSLISGNHDEIRLKEKFTIDMMKDYFVLSILAKNVPFIYYGDELGIPHNYDVSVEGGYLRTGARTPMVWNKGLNKGFSDNPKPFLPVSDIPSVEEQLNEENSLLNTVIELIKIKNQNEAFSIDGNIEFIETQKYLHFSRSLKNKRFDVVINANNHEVQFACSSKIIYCYKYMNDVLDSKGFIVYEI